MFLEQEETTKHDCSWKCDTSVYTNEINQSMYLLINPVFVLYENKCSSLINENVNDIKGTLSGREFYKVN